MCAEKWLLENRYTATTTTSGSTGFVAPNGTAYETITEAATALGALQTIGGTFIVFQSTSMSSAHHKLLPPQESEKKIQTMDQSAIEGSAANTRVLCLFCRRLPHEIPGDFVIGTSDVAQNSRKLCPRGAHTSCLAHYARYSSSLQQSPVGPTFCPERGRSDGAHLGLRAKHRPNDDDSLALQQEARVPLTIATTNPAFQLSSADLELVKSMLIAQGQPWQHAQSVAVDEERGSASLVPPGRRKNRMHKHDNEEADVKSDECTLSPEELLVAIPTGVPTLSLHQPATTIDTDASDNGAPANNASDNVESETSAPDKGACAEAADGNDASVIDSSGNDAGGNGSSDNNESGEDSSDDDASTDASDNDVLDNDAIDNTASDNNPSDTKEIENDAQTVLKFWLTSGASYGGSQCDGPSVPLPLPSTTISSERSTCIESRAWNAAFPTERSVNDADGRCLRNCHSMPSAYTLASLPLNEASDHVWRRMSNNSSSVEQYNVQSMPLPLPSSSERRTWCVESSGWGVPSPTEHSVRDADWSPHFHTPPTENSLATLPLKEAYDDDLRRIPENSTGVRQCDSPSVPLPLPSTSISAENTRVDSIEWSVASLKAHSLRNSGRCPWLNFHIPPTANALVSFPLQEEYYNMLRRIPDHSTGTQQSAADVTTTLRAESAQSIALHVHVLSRILWATYAETVDAACKRKALRLAFELAVASKSILPKGYAGDSDDTDEDTCSQPTCTTPGESGTDAQYTWTSQEDDRLTNALRDIAPSCIWKSLMHPFGKRIPPECLGQLAPQYRTLGSKNRSIMRIEPESLSALHLDEGETCITKLDARVIGNSAPGIPISQLNHQKIIEAYLSEKKRQPSRTCRHPLIPEERCTRVS